MTRVLFTIIYFLIIVFTDAAQGPVSWECKTKKIGNKLYEVRLTANVDESWHIYSQQSPKGGPLPTHISFSKNPLVLYPSKIKEVGNIQIYQEKVFGVDVYAYSGKVEFVQLVKIRAAIKTSLHGTVEYMVCTNQQCMPPAKWDFNAILN